MTTKCADGTARFMRGFHIATHARNVRKGNYGLKTGEGQTLVTAFRSRV
jgi:hypothetical protein